MSVQFYEELMVGNDVPAEAPTEFCLCLELLAFAIHPSTSQSTTTICLDPLAHRILVTAQGNLKFEDLSRERVHTVIDAMGEMLVNAALGVDKLTEAYWTNVCALSGKPTTSASELEKREKCKNNILKPLIKRFLEKTDALLLLKLKGLINDICVVTNEMLFVGNAPQLTGFHGESRILRFMYISVAGILYLKLTGGVGNPGGVLDLQVMQKIRAGFRQVCRSWAMQMGSSQGTCAECVKCLNEFYVGHGPTGNKPDQWLDPITLNGVQGTTVLQQVTTANHAIRVAFKSAWCQ